MLKKVQNLSIYLIVMLIILATNISSFATSENNLDDVENKNISKFIEAEQKQFEEEQKKLEEQKRLEEEQKKLEEEQRKAEEERLKKLEEEKRQKMEEEKSKTSVYYPEAGTLNEDGFEVIRAYNDGIVSDELKMDLKYDKYWVGRHYVVMASGTSNIRSGPGFNYPVIKKGGYGSKFTMIETVRGAHSSKNKSTEWHRIMWWEKGKVVYGYVYSPVVKAREFRFEEFFNRVKELRADVSKTQSAYINNVRDTSGRAPKFKGKQDFDAYGIPRYQAAPAYTSMAKNNSEMRYMQDGLLVSIEGEVNGMYKVRSYDYPGNYYVPKQFISKKNEITDLTQVLAIDLPNQNEITFEYRDGQWYVVSYSYATTGAVAKYKEATIPGSYKIIQKKDQFLYIHDVKKYIDGYAPYALRFNGGAFIHGVPVGFIHEKKDVVIKPAVLDEFGNVIEKAVTEKRVVEGKYTVPPHIEYSRSLGTIPLSHKCVRNITSHAKFLYELMNLQQSSIVVFD